VKPVHRLIFGDARRMARVDNQSVHLVVTSPPYWQLKDYGADQQIGFDHTYEDYINNLNLVWQECARVLYPGCRLCINIGDQFARAAYYGRYKVIPIRTEIIRFCETIGFDFMGAIVWQKVTTCNTSGGGSVMGSYPHPRNGIVKLDYEHILLFKKHGTAPKPTIAQKKKSALTSEEWNEYFAGHWQFPGEKQTDHMAMFPVELPSRLIRMFSFVTETVLDPFAGSGTTLLAASETDRNAIGYEISGEYRATIERRLTGVASLTFETDPARPDSQALDDLPYLFRDPLALDKQADPREKTFGSKISDQDTPTDQAFVRVTEIVSGVELRLEDGRTVTLRGLLPLDSGERKAIDYLEKHVRGQAVRVTGESPGPKDSVYVYLRNRTFVNAQLIRRGLVEIDQFCSTTNRALLRLRREQNASDPSESEAVKK